MPNAAIRIRHGTLRGGWYIRGSGISLMAVDTRLTTQFFGGVKGDLQVFIEEDSVTGDLTAFRFENTTTAIGSFTAVRSNGVKWKEQGIPVGSSQLAAPENIKDVETDLNGYWSSPLWQ